MVHSEHLAISPGLRPLLLAIALLIAIPAAVFYFIAPAHNDNAAEVQSFSTGDGETRDVRLDDGSELRLQSNTNVAVRYSDEQRRVQLTEGVATFIVAPDTQRPFWAQAGILRLRTDVSAFTLRLNHESILIEVLEGSVRAQSQGQLQTINAGDKVVLSNQNQALNTER